MQAGKFTLTVKRKWILIVVAIVQLALMLYGGLQAFHLRWTCDDAFISIRYADNLVNGLGLVYNAGEYVEGYTNLLWTLLLAAGIQFGFSPVVLSQNLSILCYLSLALILFAWSLYRSRVSSRIHLPIAAWLVLTLADFHEWATGGLETMLFTLLAVAGCLLVRIEYKRFWLPVFAGILFGLLLITRPDGILIAGVGIMSYFFLRPGNGYPQRLQNGIGAAVPLAITLFVLVSFKLVYYGSLFPTSFYAKSVTDPYISQGIIYIGLFLRKNWFILIAVSILPAAKYMGFFKPVDHDGKMNILFFLACLAVFIAYLVYTGGDFMFARRFIPIAPFAFLVIEEVASWFCKKKNSLIFTVLLVCAAAFPYPIYSENRPIVNQISNERYFYPDAVLKMRKKQAELVQRFFQRIPLRAAFEGGMCSFGFYSRLPYLMEITGLTQYEIAKLPIKERGIVGHEKAASVTWLAENNIHFLFKQDFPDQVAVNKRKRSYYDDLYFGETMSARILRYSDDIMDPLKNRPDIRFLPIEKVIKMVKEKIKHLPRQQAEKLLKELDRYYFATAGAKGKRYEKELRQLLQDKS